MRLIDAMEYRKCLEEEMDISDSDFHLGLEIAIADLGDMPTIDAVAVVRCRDCKNSMLWRKPADKVIGECFIRKMNSYDEQFCMVGADDFCSYGERRNNGTIN